MKALVLLIFLAFMLFAMSLEVKDDRNFKSERHLYSIYKVWDNVLIGYDTVPFVDSTQYNFDEDNVQLIIHQIQ